MLKCQSCSIPMLMDVIFGTNSDGSINRDYCKKCFVKGFFVEPEIDFIGMRDKVVEIIASKSDVSKDSLEKVVAVALADLKRWK